MVPICKETITLNSKLISHAFNSNFQNLYGRLGRKPDEAMIRVYERYSLGNKIFRDLSFSQMFKVTVTRYGSFLLVSQSMKSICLVSKWIILF